MVLYMYNGTIHVQWYYTCTMVYLLAKCYPKSLDKSEANLIDQSIQTNVQVYYERKQAKLRNSQSGIPE